MSIYDKDFFANLHTGSVRAAQQILPIVFGLSHPRSVCDIGCGIGTWLSVAKSLGVEEVLGIDGNYVDAEQLLIRDRSLRP
jgi:2-polyprenyl-3-methyl-5-hydroxy-6-metoxy-1,4-benzoquinol methylase